MAGRDPPGWKPALVPELERKVKERLRARRKRQREKYAEKARARDAMKPKKPLRRTLPVPPRVFVTVRRMGKPKRTRRIIAVRTWRRLLVLLLIQAGHTKARTISEALGTDPTSVAQSICELKRMGLLPSQVGRTPTRSRP